MFSDVFSFFISLQTATLARTKQTARYNPAKPMGPKKITKAKEDEKSKKVHQQGMEGTDENVSVQVQDVESTEKVRILVKSATSRNLGNE
jgi:hypothetical protein